MINLKRIYHLSLIICLIVPTGVQAAIHTNVQDTSIQEEHTLIHSIPRSSTFKYTSLTSTIEYGDDGKTTISTITVRNNTIDGYSLNIASSNDGQLTPASTDDGEYNIPFSIQIEASGTTGTGVDTNYELTSNELTGTVSGDTVTGASILDVSSEQSTPTDINFEVNLVIDSTAQDQMNMAGEYSDTLYFIYTDK